MTQDTWRFINTFAPWFSAAGTITAVIVALYLARRADLIRLRVRWGIRIIAGGGMKPARYLVFSVTNVGRRNARLTSLGMIAGLARWPLLQRWGGHYVWNAPRNTLSSQFPIQLADGESAHYMVLLSEFGERFRDVAVRHGGRFGALRVRAMWALVETSTGQYFRARIEPGLQQELQRLARGERLSDRTDLQVIDS